MVLFIEQMANGKKLKRFLKKVTKCIILCIKRMQNKSKLYKFLLIIFTGITGIYWIVANATNIYDVKFVGVVYEILWLPMILLLFLLPVLHSIYFYKFGLNNKILMFSFGFSITVLLIIIFSG